MSSIEDLVEIDELTDGLVDYFGELKRKKFEDLFSETNKESTQNRLFWKNVLNNLRNLEVQHKFVLLEIECKNLNKKLK